MPSLKIWGQDEALGASAPKAEGGAEAASASVAAPSEETLARGWFRSLEEYQGDRGLGARVDVQPVVPGEPIPDSLSRRSFMQLLGGGLGVAGLQACFKPPPGEILPYGKQPANLLPGEPQHYATGLEIDGIVSPLLVTCFDGRPIKVEGNPEHPENLGSTGVFEQAVLEQLYDPTRVQSVTEQGQIRSDESFRAELSKALKQQEATQGAGLRVLVTPTTSPLLAKRRAQVLQRFPKAKLVEYAPLELGFEAGTQLAFGRRLTPSYSLDKADVVVALDADFLWTVPYGQRAAREFAARRVPQGARPMNRLYAAEANLSITGMMADHRLRARSSEIGSVALGVLHAVTAQRPLAGLSVPAVDLGSHARFVTAMANDLLKAGGKSLVLVGPRQPAEVQAVGHLINLALGNLGETVSFRPVANQLETERSALAGAAAGAPTADATQGLRELVQDIDQKKVELLVVAAPDPVHSCPSDLNLGGKLGAVAFSAYLAPYHDETAKQAKWIIPAAHAFEHWGDGIAADGSHLVFQPLLAPLFGGRSEAELLGLLAHDATPPHELIYGAWHQHIAPDQKEFDGVWGELVRRGFVGTETQASNPSAPGDSASGALAKAAQRKGASEGLELNLYQSYQVHDGRYARNGWLLELPDPVTKLTWTNAALVSPKTAEKLALETGDIVELTLRNRTIRLPAYVLPGHADGAVSVALGFGQRSPLPRSDYPSILPTFAVNAADVTDEDIAGADAYALRSSAAPWFDDGLKLVKTSDHRKLALSQELWSMEGRELAIEVPASALGTRQELAGEKATALEQPSYYNPVEYRGFKWAMAIDLARCTGCSACVVACQSENNTPIVGEEQVKRGREMHWLRLDRYFTGDSLDDPGAITQPVACEHCENAPCEYVCPVNATVHSDEGLNEMVYNRCVGTRYCSNNCPYHVRRFNYLNYSYGNKSETEKMIFNPDVTVRSRGVMEKCTYCVQRIERGRISARVQGRELKDGDIKTACQTACPTQAITFGTLSDPQSAISKLREDPRSYALLKELNTRPRTTHLVRIKNKNPELA